MHLTSRGKCIIFEEEMVHNGDYYKHYL